MRLFGMGKALGQKSSPFVLGCVAIAALSVITLGLFNKDRIVTALRPGETIKINFAQDYHLRPFFSQAKVSWVPVGKVSAVEQAPDGSAIVSVKVDSGTKVKLGSQPSAVIRPTTLLGGNYFVDLVPGGDRGTEETGVIPKQRTQVPVELDKVARALQPNALHGLQTSIGNLDSALRNGGSPAIDQLLADAPGTLNPAGNVLNAAQGTRPQSDLTQVVSGLEATSRALTQNQGQLDSIVTNLRTTSSVLSNRSDDLARTIDGLPQTLATTNAGLDRLDVTLAKLRDTSDPARPVADQLTTALQHADPVLVKARPLVGQARNLLVEAQPLVQQLVPASQQATSVFNDVRGPVMDRVNGPLKQFVLSPYHGAGPYDGAGSDKPLYQELGYMFADMDRATAEVDANGNTLRLQAGVGPGSVGGLPISLEQLFGSLSKQANPPQEGR